MFSRLNTFSQLCLAQYVRVCLTGIQYVYKIPLPLNRRFMEKSKQSNSLNKLTKEIISLVSDVARNSYGVVAIAKKDEINLISKITKKGKMEEGVYVVRYPKDTFSVTIYLVLAQGIKITEALRECQKAIIYALNKKYPGLCKEVNVYALGLR